MKLSDTEIREAKGDTKPRKLADGHGLYLYVAPNAKPNVPGGKLWRMDYASPARTTRVGKDGKRISGRNTLSLGPYPEVSLEQARAKANAVRERIGAGADPAQDREAAKVEARLTQRNTFAHVAAEVVRRLRREGKSRTTIRKRLWIYRVLTNDLRSRPIAEIKASEILAVIQKVESRGKLESALRLRSAIGQAMRLAVATDRRATDPTPAMRGLIANPKVKHRAAVTTPREAGKLMVAIAGYPSPVIRSALLLSAYTFVRPGELRLATWGELDLRGRVWVIPKARTKMRAADHVVPLSKQALEQFQTLWRATGRNSDGLCFPGLRIGRPISENTVNMALRTLGFSGDEHCAHGFRAMASTILNEHSDFSPDAIEKALGHKEQDVIRGAYHRGQHMAERVKLMQWYADFLDRQNFQVWKDRVLS